jgi:hypothetical protein
MVGASIKRNEDSLSQDSPAVPCSITPTCLSMQPQEQAVDYCKELIVQATALM